MSGTNKCQPSLWAGSTVARKAKDILSSPLCFKAVLRGGPIIMTHSMGAKARDRCTPLAVDCAHCAQFPMNRRRRPQVDGSMGVSA